MSSYYNGTSAYNFDYGTTTVEENIEARASRRSSRKAAFMKRVRAFSVFFCIFAIAIGLLVTNAIIIEKTSTLNDMQTQLTELREENKKKTIDIESNLDHKRIEDIAINELGMKRPDKYQVVYVNVEQNDYAEVMQQPEQSGFTSTFGVIGAGLNDFVEYIN
ncbi:MAG: cell division protein FtsL [Clostridia bacterium]|nr:cell division protein FtsL [Clostridia bacterium]